MLYHGATLLRDHINTPDAGLYVAFQILSKMVTINHLREGGKERTKSEMLDMVRVCALQIPCESDQPPVKTACTNCRRAKVKCIFESGVACTRCSRLNLECLPHVPTKRKRLCPAERAAASGGQSPECASSKRPFLGNRDGPAMSLDRSQLQQNDMRAALEALAKGDAQRHAA
ncbi:hypothetical protein EMIHUDRAFT_249373 [Emiliania huxleyi CCMP1516]|uniref:Zn(2)-C6 fungal-type domain-containing protein n=2 Tax=Emiliania huxleyi TaxID=2903 RepID=A0A0D3I992_EMIH1|nr:hypothetical protein EMIHUDRAFT_249373 [Emiliania huxleyi CCMP1516]EOD07827.1 hypothetical protein EMIHUDRAFT_249373 [Emiliania huxleyi CCMP1516]|eukprot:XP_005760256.1 hypothetical protein EMIHUDRAFT_249373 [Emiliania huxleyi CCMP1516]